MVRKVGVATAKARLSELLRQVEVLGVEIVVERRGRPVAVIGPYEDPRSRSRPHWAAALDGLARDLDDFLPLLEEAVGSRAEAGTRAVRLDEAP